jgi:cytidylate kinase
VVFPDALIKLYFTARPEVRARRRTAETPELDYETVLQDIARRDRYDAGRAASPMQQAVDSVEVDTSDMTLDEVVDKVADMVAEREKTDG